MDKKSVAIILAGGHGSRMGSSTPKQYIDLGSKPLIYYSLKAFEESDINELILVVGKEDILYNKEKIVGKYNFTKVKKIVEGGSERYLSVYQGLKAIKSADFVLIHDGARPFVTKELINKVIKQVKVDKACVVGMPSKDTVKIVNDDNVVSQTPNRNHTWIVQTPQAFSYSLIMKAYHDIMEKVIPHKDISITDDAMVLEYTSNFPIKLIEGSYLNIKITTPEDLLIGNAFIKQLS